MSEQQYKKLTRRELDALAGEELPERAAMSLLNANVAAPVNVAEALAAAREDASAEPDAGDVPRGNY